MKKNLPVLLIRGLVLLPNNELRIEFDNDESKNIIDVSEMFHDNRLLIISGENPLEEKFKIDKLPKIGVLAKVLHKIELPNGNLRVLISGKKRCEVIEYLPTKSDDDVLESIVELKKDEEIEDELVLINKLYKEVEALSKLVPHFSDSLLALIKNVDSLSKMTDMVVPFLHNDFNRIDIYKYLKTFDAQTRLEMILTEIYQEKELYRIEKKIDHKIKSNLEDSQKEYLLREKVKAIKEELGEISNKEEELDILRKKITNLSAPKNIKQRLNQELKRYETLPQTSPEINVVRNYIDWLLDLPWNKSTKDNSDLKKVKQCLDETHFGLNKIKERFIEYLAVKNYSDNVKSPIICLVGPPGVGKTSMAFSIAEALNRKFVKISVGGINDEAEIIGHRRTYIGANPGRIIQSLKKAKSNNPVFLIDEIDKMTKDYKGDPASVLLEVLDQSQNKLFSDNYLEEEFDLSKILFITTANYIEDIPEALLDRLEVIKLNSYTEYEKLDIVKKHLLKKILENHGVKNKQITIEDEVILEIIRAYTKEAGVRELERQLSKIVRKIITQMVIGSKKTLKTDVKINELEKYLGKEKYSYKHITNEYKVGVVNGLAYTQYGGDVLPIEVNYYEGNNNLILTGSLGNVMKESAQIALSYIKSNYKKLKIDKTKLDKNDIHIHVPEGATPKEGPSAGIALTTSIISSLSNMKVPASLAMTGEITLNGKVLPIGGLREKVIGAYRAGVRKIIIPFENKKDIDEIPKEIKKQVKIYFVKEYNEVLNEVLNENNNK